MYIFYGKIYYANKYAYTIRIQIRIKITRETRLSTLGLYSTYNKYYLEYSIIFECLVLSL